MQAEIVPQRVHRLRRLARACRRRFGRPRAAARRCGSCSMSSRSCVAISSVTPTSLKRVNSSMISSDSSGSRLPVGSSAISTSGAAPRRARCRRAAARPSTSVIGACDSRPRKPDLVERRAHALLDLAAARAGDHERQRDVVEDAAVVEQLVVLEHDAEPLPERRNLAARDARRVLVVDEHRAARRPLDQRDQAQQRALAGARRARQEHELAALDARTTRPRAPRGRSGNACRRSRTGS